VLVLKQQSIRRQVMVMAGLLLLPIVGGIALSANRARLDRQEAVRSETVSLALIAAAHIDESLKSLDVMASNLRRHPAVLALDTPACNQLFAALLREQPLLSNVMLVHPNGAVRGSVLPADGGERSRPWFREVLETRKTAIGGFDLDAVSRKPTVTWAYPIEDASSTLVGVLGLTVDVSRLQAVFAEIPLPDHSVVTVFDQTGRILARSAEQEKFVGVRTALTTPRNAERIDVDGMRRINGDASIRRAPWLLSVGMPGSVGPRFRSFRTRMIVMVLGVVAVSLWFAFWLARIMSRDLDYLRLAAERIAAGDLSPLLPRQLANRELSRLQETFVAMAANISETRNALDRQVEQERKMNEALQSLQRQVVRQERLAAVGSLASGVAHELNNPLQAIVGVAQLLERRHGLPPEALQDVAFVQKQSSRAREVIRNLSRFSSQDLEPSVALDLRDVVKAALSFRQQALERLPVTLSVEMTTSKKVYANFAELEQVIVNLLINAQQALETKTSGPWRIDVRLFDVGRKVRLEILDNGAGVSPEDEPKLFQPFFTTKPVGRGAGLGLSVGYGIVHSYGGTIGYAGNEWGGATFFFELPAVDGDGQESDEAVALRTSV
jgi:C4-dicarboxylate-specific signal transduction histidine kinase